MKHVIAIIILLISVKILAQQTISGTVFDEKNNPIAGANIYLEGTYDGATSDEYGKFSFKTSEQGIQKLVVSYVSFQTFTFEAPVSNLKNLIINLREAVNSLDAVVLSAGTFSAGDNSKVNALKPLDVVTTASALGDFVGALQTLPGTTTVAEDGRLFVRGGDAEETQIFIDGIRVFTPYTTTTNNAPTRGRYSPFLFDGITFSTGGYSAEYGQALSSVLLLKTVDEPDQDKTDISLMSVGAGVGKTKKWQHSSLIINTSYTNLAPYIAVFSDRNTWKKPFETLSGETVFRKKTTVGLFKFYAAFDTSNFELTQDDINHENGVNVKVDNRNTYLNSSYNGVLNAAWSFFGGASFTQSNNKSSIIQNQINNKEQSVHTKLSFKNRISNGFKLYLGAEYFSTNFTENFQDVSITDIAYGFDNNIAALYAESDVIISKKLAFKMGVRAEYSQLLNDFNVAPRLSLAYKTSQNGQLSFAYGNFFQSPTNDVLKFSSNAYASNMRMQNTSHYILNYQYNKDGQVFRLEGFYKKYDNLVKYDTNFISFNSHFNNEGFGYAKGIDLFWRANNSVKNLDYWVSYSLLDTKRNYKNFSIAAQPNFANTHNLSVVGKYWINALRSQVGLSCEFASGRTYTNPNMSGFLNQKTKAFNNLSLNWSYLITPQKILYASVNNVLGFKNINGYQYANIPDGNGNFNRRALLPAANQFFFVGFFWTISNDKTSNQLNNL